MPIQLTPQKEESLKKIGIASAVVILFAIEFGYQIYKYVKERKEEDDDE